MLQTNDGNLCLSYYEHQCAGICSSETRLEGIWRTCLDRPLEKGERKQIPEIPEGEAQGEGTEDERRR